MPLAVVCEVLRKLPPWRCTNVSFQQTWFSPAPAVYIVVTHDKISTDSILDRSHLVHLLTHVLKSPRCSLYGWWAARNLREHRGWSTSRAYTSRVPAPKNYTFVADESIYDGSWRHVATPTGSGDSRQVATEQVGTHSSDHGKINRIYIYYPCVAYGFHRVHYCTWD